MYTREIRCRPRLRSLLHSYSITTRFHFCIISHNIVRSLIKFGLSKCKGGSASDMNLERGSASNFLCVPIIMVCGSHIRVNYLRKMKKMHTQIKRMRSRREWMVWQGAAPFIVSTHTEWALHACVWLCARVFFLFRPHIALHSSAHFIYCWTVPKRDGEKERIMRRLR